MNISDADRKKIIDYYFQYPGAKSVLEDEDIKATREEVEDFLETVYKHLVEVFTPMMSDSTLVHKSHLQQLYIESKDDEDFANEVKLLIDAEKL